MGGQRKVHQSCQESKSWNRRASKMETRPSLLRKKASRHYSGEEFREEIKQHASPKNSSQSWRGVWVGKAIRRRNKALPQVLHLGMYEWTSQWIGDGKQASDGGGAGNNTTNGEEELWNGNNTINTGISAMTINARIMLKTATPEKSSTGNVTGNIILLIKNVPRKKKQRETHGMRLSVWRATWAVASGGQLGPSLFEGNSGRRFLRATRAVAFWRPWVESLAGANAASEESISQERQNNWDTTILEKTAYCSRLDGRFICFMALCPSSIILDERFQVHLILEKTFSDLAK